MTRRKNTTASRRRGRAEPETQDKLPIVEHLRELRRRLLYIAVTVVAGGALVYGFERQVIDVLLRPSGGQEFIYTSPMGGMNFIITVCLGLGLVLATPVIMYQLLAFLRPLMGDTTRRFLLGASAAAGAMALAGVAFGYFVGLPSALHFLLHQFTNIQVQPLLTIQAYTQFVALYLLGSALMFQLPLVVLFINRIKPLKPRKLLKHELHVFAGSIILALVINPSPNLVDQLFAVIPLFLSYQASIFLLWFVQRKNSPSRQLQFLREQDARRQAERMDRPLRPFTPADLPMLPTPKPLAPIAPVSVTATATKPASAPAPVKTQKQRRFMDFAPSPKPQLAPLHRQIPVIVQ